MDKNISFIFFATAWSAVEGGVNSFNFDLCNAISMEGIDIYVVLPHDAELHPNPTSKITLIKVPEEFDRFGRVSMDLIKNIISITNNTTWIGHDAITGGMALMMVDYAGGRSVVIHHMDYSNYYYLKSDSSSKKIQAQRALIKKSDIVICVGPRLLNDAKHLRPSFKETYEIIPGVASCDLENGRKSFDYRISFCGRISKSEDKVKNIGAGIRAAAKCLSEVTSKNGSLTLIGVEKTDLHSYKDINRSIAINTIPYITNREEYFSELACSDILIMPSVKEGFGLVAWEAISLGIPVIISQSSGLYEHLKSLELDPLVYVVNISGLPVIDENIIAAQIRNCFLNYEVAKANAVKLSVAVRNNTWSKVAIRFVELITLDSRQADSANILKDQSKPEQLKPLAKRAGIIDKDIQAGGTFDRFEDLLAITVRKRELVFGRNESTDYSRGQKIKFEFWSALNPLQSYYLYLPPFVNLKQTIGKFCKLISSTAKQMPSRIFVLRRDKGDASYLKKLFSDNNFEVEIQEYSLKEYIWEYCIDDEFKLNDEASTPLNYVDQEITGDDSVTLGSSARELLVGKLSDKPDCSAYLVIAPGGMGKTWLCRCVAAEAAQKFKDSRLIVLIQAEGLRDYIREVGSAHIQVSTIFDLYEIYARAQGIGRKYDRNTFELSILTGNIVLIIDGLDELVTVLQERFDLSKFLDSIVEMSTGLQSSHILLTTRDGLLLDVETSNAHGVERYELLGFTDRDWTKYANKRFIGNPERSQIVEKLKTTLSNSKLSIEGGRVVPFFVDVLCNIFEDEISDGCNISFALSDELTPYPSNNEIIDKVVYSVFRRELRRQSIDLDITQLVGLLAEVVSEHGEDFGSTVLLNNLELYYETRAGDLIKKIKLNPLLRLDGNLIRLRYDFLQSYFRALFLIDCLQRSMVAPEALGAYAKCNSAEGPEIQYLSKYYSAAIDKLESQLSILFPKLRDIVKENVEVKRIELARRAMSGVWKVYRAARQFTGAKLTEKIVEILPGSVPGRSIDGLALYGDFPPLDFTDTTVINSKFLDYSNFGRSKFVGAKFIACVFERCGGVLNSGGTLHLAKFESSCNLGDVSELVAHSESLVLSEDRLIEAECLPFLRSFFKAGGEYDPKKDWIKFSTKVRGLRIKDFDRLLPEFIVIKVKKSNETYYSVSPSFVESARKFIDNNYIDNRMRSFIYFVK